MTRGCNINGECVGQDRVGCKKDGGAGDTFAAKRKLDERDAIVARIHKQNALNKNALVSRRSNFSPRNPEDSAPTNSAIISTNANNRNQVRAVDVGIGEGGLESQRGAEKIERDSCERTLLGDDAALGEQKRDGSNEKDGDNNRKERL